MRRSSWLFLALLIVACLAALEKVEGFAVRPPNSAEGRRLAHSGSSMRACAGALGAKFKVLHFVRHGQAQHNVRAEPARHAGCSYDDFLELMRLDDAFDAELTPAGIDQAKTLQQGAAGTVRSSIQLVVASSLTRAIQTADLVFPDRLSGCPRVSLDQWREVSGLLVNAQRRTRTELRRTHTSWDFDNLESENDMLWKPEALENTSACAHRAYLALQWAWQRPEERIAIVAHGGNTHKSINTRQSCACMYGSEA